MKNMTGIFRDLQSNRRNAAAAKMTWGVYSYTKAGALYKAPSVLCADESAAQAKAIELARLNPDRRYMAKLLA